MRSTSAEGFSRRRLLCGAAGAITAAPAIRAAQITEEGIRLRAPAPAGPAPLGAPVETAVPFSDGALRDGTPLAVFSPTGKPVLSQTRVSMRWPGGSTRWLAVVFEAQDGPGDYVLRRGASPAAGDLVRRSGGDIDIDTGAVRLLLRTSAAGLGCSLFAPDRTGARRALTGGLELLVTRHDGKVFRSSMAGDTLRTTIEEAGPLRASVLVEGHCRAEDGSKLFECAIRWTCFRGRPEVAASITWINSTDAPSEQVRDIRFLVPFDFAPDRLVIGCQTGVYDGPFLKDWPVFVLQEDHDRYWVKTRNPDGRLQHLSSGGCNGEHCPGWMYVQGPSHVLGVWVPDFWQEYPNELTVRHGELSVGLWPERAAAHLATKPILPANPDGEQRYVKTKYWPVLPHPYLAFFDQEHKCLDARQGLAKTQQIVLSVWGGSEPGPLFEKKWWSGTLKPVRAHLDPHCVAKTGVLGILSARGRKESARFDRLFDGCYGWFNRHIDQLKCYGKFDYGDFKYFTPSTTYMTHPGTKWGKMGEMAREGYWSNNEGDPFLGLLLYYYRTGNPQAWRRCESVARHLLDVDIRHTAPWGMYTHAYGHCYVETDRAGAPDHSWLLGLLAWAGASGDPVVWKWLLRCGEELARFKPDFTLVDARTVSVHLHMMCRFHAYTGDGKYLEAAKAPAEALIKVQNADGSWPAYMLSPTSSRAPGFVDHATAALADYYDMTGDARALKAIDKAIDIQFREATLDIPLVGYALAVLAKKTNASRYAALARRLLEYLDRTQNRSGDPIGDGDVGWAEWGVHNADAARGSGRPPQFLNQTRPLIPGFVLAYMQPCLAVIEEK